jgi:lysophospholipase L1-like esterase
MIWKLILLKCLCATALHITGLGSSFAKGPGVAKNYVHLLGSKLGAEVLDVSKSGSTLAGISDQVEQIPSHTDIITITSGGNDLGYMAGLMRDSRYVQISEEELASLYGRVLNNIHARASKARVYVIEYLTILGPDIRAGINVPFNASRVEHHREVAATLLRATQKAADSKPFAKSIPVAANSASHGVGSQKPWINGDKATGDGVSWHPNAAGMKAIADMLYEAAK